MSESDSQKIKIAAIGTAFQQICNFVAISDTRSPSDSLSELILHSLLSFDGDKLRNAKDVADILKTIFGVDAPTHQIEHVIDHLIEEGHVQNPLGTNYVLSSAAREKVQARIDQASQLQNQVKLEWQNEILKRFPSLNSETAWNALQAYLAKAFLRHGIQAVTFLDPSIDLPGEYAISLSKLLNEVVESKFEPAIRPAAREAISGFLAGAGRNQDRTQFIAECADGAFNYFSLMVAPEVSATFREKLNSLVLFCDTNFLFGILDLHVHPQVEISNHLLEVIVKHKLPFRLRYHEATLKESQSTIAYYGDKLKRQRWERSLSRAAITSPFVGGIELKYHQMNSETGVDVDAFLRPFQHVDILLKDKMIDIYRPSSERMDEKATLYAEYAEFLKKGHKEKSYESANHDITLLDCVRSLRNGAKSTLEAGALLVTCDYTLYRFDSVTCQKDGIYPSVVLPNVLWQILRPFVPASIDFNRCFAETFAIPEFRTIGSGAAKACSKMLGLLAVYKNFPEETATRLLSNDMLMDRLRKINNDEKFAAEVELAIASDNEALLEERASLAIQVESLRAEKEQAEKALVQQKQAAELENAKVEELVQAKNIEVRELAAERDIAYVTAKEATSSLAKEQTAKTEAEKTAKKALELQSESERVAHKYAVAGALIVSILLIIVFEVVVYLLPWAWLKGHASSYGLQGCISLMLLFGNVGLWVKQWRNALWLVGFFGVMFVLLQLLGGPKLQ